MVGETSVVKKGGVGMSDGCPILNGEHLVKGLCSKCVCVGDREKIGVMVRKKKNRGYTLKLVWNPSLELNITSLDSAARS